MDTVRPIVTGTTGSYVDGEQSAEFNVSGGDYGWETSAFTRSCRMVQTRLGVALSQEGKRSTVPVYQLICRWRWPPILDVA